MGANTLPYFRYMLQIQQGNLLECLPVLNHMVIIGMSCYWYRYYLRATCCSFLIITFGISALNFILLTNDFVTETIVIEPIKECL